jgi:hypothetical protein
MEYPTSDLPTQPKRQNARSLEDIHLDFGPITSVSYEPFQIEPRQAATVPLCKEGPAGRDFMQIMQITNNFICKMHIYYAVLASELPLLALAMSHRRRG